MNEIVDGDRTSDPAHRRDRGIEAYARIFDVPEKDLPAAMARRVGQVFAEEVFLAAGGPAWFHPALTDRERSMLIIAALAAQGVAGERLDRHVRLAQRNGLDYEALTAMMTLVTNYIGQARGSQAMGSRPAGRGSGLAGAVARLLTAPAPPGHRPGNADFRRSSR